MPETRFLEETGFLIFTSSIDLEVAWALIEREKRSPSWRRYLKPTAACQTKANSKKKTGMSGKTSTKGSKIW